MSALKSKNRPCPSQVGGRSSQEDAGFHLHLKSVIGTTTTSPNSFDSLPEIDTFAFCAGSAVIVARVDAQLGITQQFYRARPNIRSVNETHSFYNPSTPPPKATKNRFALSLKDSGHRGGCSFEESATESPGTSQLSKRTREASCISLSPEGHLLAVGERGKSPRILIFSRATNAPLDIPLSVLTDHSFGVRSVAFSPDSRWLCSLGDLHDGFLFLWAINGKSGSGRLHASNKCQSAHDIRWIGRNLVSFGTRHVKVWRLEPILAVSPSKTQFENENLVEKAPLSPGPKTFFGRNCLLGPLMDAVFTCLVAISDSNAILCTDRGDVCLLLLGKDENTQRLDRVAQVSFSISCVTVEKERDFVWIAGRNGGLRALPLQPLISMVYSHSPRFSEASTSQSSIVPEIKPSILAIGMVLGRVVTVDSDHIIELREIENGGDALSTCIKSTRLAAHSSAVLGVTILNQPNARESDFFTWSARGTVLFWTLSGTCKGCIEIDLEWPSPLDDHDGNELRVFRAAESDEFFVSGDKEGFLQLIDRGGETIFTIKAHNGDINDIAIHPGASDRVLVVSCGRDKTLQLFQKAGAKLLLLQTILDHVASVNNVVFLNDFLLSSSSDRTICIRTMAFRADNSIAFLPTRVIALKSSPVTLSVEPDRSEAFIVSTMDRHIHKYDVFSGRSIHNFKPLDPNNGDSLTLSSLSAQSISNDDTKARVILGVSSSDRSIRIFDYDTGSMLAKEHGQTVVSSIAFIQNSSGSGNPTNFVVSTGLDGTVMIWELAVRSQRSQQSNRKNEALQRCDNIDPLKTPSFDQPIRRILSKSEISDFQLCLDTMDTPTPTKSHSPPRLRKKSSIYSMNKTNKSAIISLPAKRSLTTSSTLGSSHHKLARDRSQTPPSPNVIIGSKSTRPSLDGRHHIKSTGNAKGLNSSAKQICTSIRMLREQLASSTESLEPHTAEQLELELNLTIRAMGEKTVRNQAANEMFAGNLLDEYLARMIDERLALKAKSGDAVSMGGEANVEITPAENGDVELSSSEGV